MINKNLTPEDYTEYELIRSQYATLTDLLRGSCEKYSNNVAFENMGTKLTFAKLEELSCNFASFLINHTKLQKGDKIALQMPNILQYPVALYGALKVGLVIVNINPLYTPEEMFTQIKDSGTKAIVVLENFAYKLNYKNVNLDNADHRYNLNLHSILEKTDLENVIITKVGDLMGTFKGFMVNSIVKYIKKMIPKYDRKHTIYFKDALELGKKTQYYRPTIYAEDLAFLQYTTGTTGASKGAMLTHKNIVSNLSQVSIWLKNTIKNRVGDETAISPLPLYHIFSLTVSFIMIKLGVRNILITNPKDLDGFIKELKKYRFTLLTGVNTLFKALLNKSEFKKIDFNSCKIVMGGAASIEESVSKKWYDITGTKIIEGYGLTEACPGVAVNHIENPYENSVGFPFIDTEVKVIDKDERELGPNQKGELIVKGPQIMEGYWSKKEATKQAVVNGWLKTGDIATIDENGLIKIVDRKKEIVIISGFNVYPNEIDNIVTMHPKVLEAACIGVPDEKSGEALKLFVVKKDQSLTVQEIKAFCRSLLTGYKIPKYIEFRGSLPKSAVGKISKKDLKEEFGI